MSRFVDGWTYLNDGDSSHDLVMQCTTMVAFIFLYFCIVMTSSYIRQRVPHAILPRINLATETLSVFTPTTVDWYYVGWSTMIIHSFNYWTLNQSRILWHINLALWFQVLLPSELLSSGQPDASLPFGTAGITFPISISTQDRSTVVMIKFLACTNALAANFKRTDILFWAPLTWFSHFIN